MGHLTMLIVDFTGLLGPGSRAHELIVSRSASVQLYPVSLSILRNEHVVILAALAGVVNSLNR